jgi:hypothetical protein
MRQGFRRKTQALPKLRTQFVLYYYVTFEGGDKAALSQGKWLAYQYGCEQVLHTASDIVNQERLQEG